MPSERLAPLILSAYRSITRMEMCKDSPVADNSLSIRLRNFFRRHFFTNALTFYCTQAREISRTEKPRRAICEKSKRKPWHFFAANLWGLREPSFAEVTFKTGCAEGTLLMPKQYPKRAPKRFSEPPIKSSVPDAPKSIPLR